MIGRQFSDWALDRHRCWSSLDEHLHSAKGRWAFASTDCAASTATAIYMENFFGTEHFLQNSPYLYGYTGSMVYCIFADFTEFSMEGASALQS